MEGNTNISRRSVLADSSAAMAAYRPRPRAQRISGNRGRRHVDPGETQVLRILFGIEVAAVIALALGSAVILGQVGAASMKWIPGISLFLGWAVWKIWIHRE